MQTVSSKDDIMKLTRAYKNYVDNKEPKSNFDMFKLLSQEEGDLLLG
jgi:hypothetical protein